jgi:hypothetical protein
VNHDIEDTFAFGPIPAVKEVAHMNPRDVRSSSDHDIVHALRLWRDGLINLTGHNRALNFRPTKTGTVTLDSPSLAEIFDGLRSKKAWSFRGRPEYGTGSPTP